MKPTSNQSSANATNQFMTDWNSKNPTGYADERSFMVGNSDAYWAHQNKRQNDYNAWAAGQNTNVNPSTAAFNQVQPAGAANNQGTGMGIVQRQLPQNQPQLFSGQQPQGVPFVAGQGAAPGGIIATSAAPNAANGTINAVAGYNAAQLGQANQWNVNSEQTAQGQLGNILSQNSGLMQQAESRAAEQMNARGLVNSSMALTAGQSAVYDAATPIAQQDAETYAKSAGYNADIQNQFEMQNKGWQNEANQFGADAQNKVQAQNQANTGQRWGQQLDADLRASMAQVDAQIKRDGFKSQESINRENNATQKYTADLSASLDREMAYLDSNTRKQLQGMSDQNKLQVLQLDNQHKSLIQGSVNAQNIMSQAMASIAQNEQGAMSTAGKNSASNNIMAVAQSSLSTLAATSSIPNYSSWFNVKW